MHSLQKKSYRWGGGGIVIIIIFFFAEAKNRIRWVFLRSFLTKHNLGISGKTQDEAVYYIKPVFVIAVGLAPQKVPHSLVCKKTLGALEINL